MGVGTPRKLFVWDFHGTLEKGNEEACRIVTNLALKRSGFSERISHDLNLEMYGAKWNAFFKRVLPHAPLQVHLDLEALAFRISTDEPEHIEQYVKPNDWSLHVLSTIQDVHFQILISNTKKQNLDFYLKTVGMTRFFPGGFAKAADNHAGDGLTKEAILEELLAGRAFDHYVFIGDTPADLQLAQVPGLERSTRVLYRHPGLSYPPCDSEHKTHNLRTVLREI